MRTESELKSRADHPAGKAFDVPEPVVVSTDDGSPYRGFMDALEDLESTRLLHGAASLEAEMSAARVRKLREQVIAAWRTRAA